MEMTVKQNVNFESIILQHKIALEASTMLEDREIVLDTDVALYTMVSLVNNAIEEDLMDIIEKDKREFIDILTEDIEPKFWEIVKQYNCKEVYDKIVAINIKFLNDLMLQRNTVFGLVNRIAGLFGEQNWGDLQFFFNDLKQKGMSILEQYTQNLPPVAETKQVVQRARTEKFEGASAQMQALLDKYQQENVKNN